MGETLQPHYEALQNNLSEAISEYGPWAALGLFSNADVTGMQRTFLLDATRQAIWSTVERGNSKEVDDHLLVLDFMDRSVAAQMLMDFNEIKHQAAERAPVRPAKVSPSNIPTFLMLDPENR